MRDLLLVAAGGAIGASARHLMTKAALVLLPLTFPWGTFLINVLGCLAIGIVAGLAQVGVMTPSGRLFVATGILGGYTTFSTFGLDTQSLIAGGRPVTALANILGQVVLGLLGVYVGLAIARRFA